VIEFIPCMFKSNGGFVNLVVFKKNLRLSALILILCLSFWGCSASAMQSTNAIVDRVLDGDTIDVFINGQSNLTTVRILGVQAMEENLDSPSVPASCHSTEATNFLKSILKEGDSVRLESIFVASSSRGRLLRHVFKVSGVAETNIGLAMVESGHAFAQTFAGEDSYDGLYVGAHVEAMREGRRIWRDNYCGDGPSVSADISIWLNADADGDDTQNINGEWIKLRNDGVASVNLSRWTVRDKFLNSHVFQNGTLIGPNEIFTVFVGEGTNTSKKFYLNLSQPIFGNDIVNFAYLMEPLNGVDDPIATGDMRASFITPLDDNCSDENLGNFELTVNYDAPGVDTLVDPNGEWVQINNLSNTAIDLTKYVVRAPFDNFFFPENYILGANQTVRIFVGQGSNTQESLFMQREQVIFNNSSGQVQLRTFQEKVVAGYEWSNPDNSGKVQGLQLETAGCISTSPSPLIPAVDLLLKNN